MSKPIAETRQDARQAAVSSMKQSLILDAAREIFESEGIEGASIRAIAKRAGYTPGAIYFHFASKEDIYATLLDQSLDALVARVTASINDTDDPVGNLYRSGRVFFDFYNENPRDLDLGFYLFRGGMRPHGVGPDSDRMLNEKLLWALAPIQNALQEMGCSEHTARMRLFATSASDQVDKYLRDLTQRVVEHSNIP